MALTRDRIVRLQRLDAKTAPTAGDLFRFALPDGRALSQRTDAAAALDRAIDRIDREPTMVGVLGGHTLLATGTRGYDKHGQVVQTITWRLDGDAAVDLTTTSGPGEPNRVDLGTMRRLEHLNASIPSHLDQCRRRVYELEHTLAQSERLQHRPFRHAAELAAARARYSDLTARVAEIQNQPAGDEPPWEAVTAANSPGRDAGRAQSAPMVSAAVHSWSR